MPDTRIELEALKAIEKKATAAPFDEVNVNYLAAARSALPVLIEVIEEAVKARDSVRDCIDELNSGRHFRRDVFERFLNSAQEALASINSKVLINPTKAGGGQETDGSSRVNGETS